MTLQESKSKGKKDTQQVNLWESLPADIQRAIEEQAREWQETQRQEEEDLVEEIERDQVYQDVLQAYGIESELKQLASWKTECR